jgi:glucose-fructose oxidoreductase
MAKQIRYGIVGLGHIAQVAVLPAFKSVAKNSVITALVTEDPKKAIKISNQYKVPGVFGYEQFDELLKSDIVDALYICLPNNMHVEYAVRALNAGIHVLCEKPLALSTEDCLEMEQAAESSGAKLMTAYRLHFEEANLEALKICKSKKLGDLRYFSSNFSFQVTDLKNIRLQSDKGGGPVWDIGIYCINAARTVFRSEPIEVTAIAARGPDRRFKEVDEMLSVSMRFPQERLATFTCSFGADTEGFYEVVGTKGAICVEDAYEYAGPRTLYVMKDGSVKATKKFKKVDQFAPEIAYFSDCILKNRAPEPSAREGYHDVRVIEAILESIETKKSVTLDPERHRGPKENMREHYRGHEEPETVNVHSPHN